MTTERLSSVAAIQFAWATLRGHLAPLLILGAAALMLSMISRALGRSGGNEVLLSLVVQFFHAAVWLVLLRVALNLHDGAPVDLSEPKPLLMGFWRFLLVFLVMFLVVALGFALLVVPGVLLGLAFGFAPLFAADGEREVAEAFRKSHRLTRGAWGPLFVLWLTLAGLNLLGVLALGVGIVVTVPMTALCLAYAFRHLQGRSPVALSPSGARLGERGMTPH